MKRYKAVYIRWLDHVKTADDPKRLKKPSVRHTVGWLVKENDRHIVLAMDRCKSDREYGFLILRSDILKLRKLR